MSVKIGQLYRKRTVRNLNGDIIDWVDETRGGSIISKGRIVNEKVIIEENKKIEDRKVAAQAIQHQVQSPNAETRNELPKPDNSKVEALEKKVEGMESKLDAILSAINKK